MIESAAPAIPVASTALVALLIASALLAFLYPVFRRAIVGADPATRSFAVLCYGLMAPVTGIVVALLSMHPEIAQFLVPEHCHRGACGSHIPAVDPRSVGGLGLAAAGTGLALFALLILGNALLAGQRRLRTLYALARQVPAREYHLLESDDVVAWCCGLLRPKIVVSRGLVARLDASQLDVILAHEAAHANRLDNLRALLLRWATVLWPASLQRVRKDMRDDCESACDAAALAATADRQVFAEALGTIARFGIGGPPPRAAAFGHTETTARLAALPEDPCTARRVAHVWLALSTVWLIQMLVVTSTSHYLVEWLGL